MSIENPLQFFSEFNQSYSNVEKFTHYAQKLHSFVESTVSENTLEDRSFFNSFARTFNNDILTQSKGLTEVSDDYWPALEVIFKSAIELGNFGILHYHDWLISLLWNTLGEASSSIFVHCQEFYSFIIDYAKQIQVIPNAIRGISAKCSSFENFSSLFHTIKISGIMLSPSEFEELLVNSSLLVIEFVKKNLREISSSDLQKVFEFLSKEVNQTENNYSHHILNYWTQISVILISSDIFDKKLQGYQILTSLSHVQNDFVSNYLTENHVFSIFEINNPHPQFLLAIGNLLYTLLPRFPISDEIILSYWNLHSSLHSSSLVNYYDMIRDICYSGTDHIFMLIANLIDKDQTHSQLFLKFLSEIAILAGEKPSGQPVYSIIYKKLRKEVFKAPEPRTLELDLLSRAFGFHMTSENFPTKFSKVSRNR